MSNEDVEDEDDLQPVAAAVERPVPVECSAPAPAELAVAVANPVPENPPARAANSGLSPRGHKSKEKQDFYTLMALQMKNDSDQRAHDAREAAANRQQLTSLISTITDAYFSPRGRKKGRRKKRKHVSRLSESRESSFSDESDGDESIDSEPKQKRRSTRSAD